MPYLNAKGYCRVCKKMTAHRFSLKVKCLECHLESSQERYRQGVEEAKGGRKDVRRSKD